MKSTSTERTFACISHLKFALPKRIPAKATIAISTIYGAVLRYWSCSGWELPFDGSRSCLGQGAASQGYNNSAVIFWSTSYRLTETRLHVQRRTYSPHTSTIKGETSLESDEPIQLHNLKSFGSVYAVCFIWRRCFERWVGPSFLKRHIWCHRRIYREDGQKSRGCMLQVNKLIFVVVHEKG